MSGRSLENFIKWLDPLNPTRSYLLDLFRLDKPIVRACGHTLYDRDGREYLDFLSQFGAVSLGHNHPELRQALVSCLDSQFPAMVQPFSPLAAQELARELARVTPGELAHVVFANSGAETVEAAIKLARAKTGRLTILSTLNGFHGKTLGALSATGKAKYQKPFGAPVPGFEYVPFGDIDALESKLQNAAERLAAFLVEPIQGEGGINLAPPGYLASALALCRRYKVLTILDEIQTGLGRTGRLFAIEQSTASPDILLLAKALGGGLFPIGACISTAAAWDHEFGYLHSSTFAGNNLACRTGLTVLRILTRDNQQLVRHVAESGSYLLHRLRELQAKYPLVIKDVRGCGFLVGLELWPFTGEDSYTMSYFSSGDYVVALIAGYLLNVHGLLTAPVFNHAHVLRIEPPFTVGKDEIDRLLAALDCLCDALDRRDYRQLLGYLIQAPHRVTSCRFFAPHPPNPAPPAADTKARGKFAFVIHYTHEQDLLRTDPSFSQFTATEFTRWKEYIEDSAEPGIVYHLEHLRSATGATAEGWLIAIARLPDTMVRLGRRRMLPVLKDAVRVAKDQGSKILGLGGFTSILSRGGESLVGDGIAITSGSSLTAVMTVAGIDELCAGLELALADRSIAVVGAAGAIGRLITLLLAGRVGRLTLVGNGARPDSALRLRVVAEEAYRHLFHLAAHPAGGSHTEGDLLAALRAGVAGAPDQSATTEGLLNLPFAEAPIRWHTKLDLALPAADVVITATSATADLVQPGHLKRGAIVCDVARPSNVSDQVLLQRRDVLVFEGGLVQFPEPVHFGPNLQGFPPGVNLACLAETILLALEQDYGDHSIGQELSLAEAEYLDNLARKHGFRAARPHWHARPLSEEDLWRVKAHLAPLAYSHGGA